MSFNGPLFYGTFQQVVQKDDILSLSLLMKANFRRIIEQITQFKADSKFGRCDNIVSSIATLGYGVSNIQTRGSCFSLRVDSGFGKAEVLARCEIE